MEELTVKVGFGIAFICFLCAIGISNTWLWGALVGAGIALFGLYFMED